MRVAVLGAGLQGACVALELAAHGIDVDLYDKNDACLTQAAAQNEGKIHLGYVYACDPTLQTARLMIKGAAAFAPLMRRWIGDDIDEVPVSSPFHYAVHRQSLISAEAVWAHLQACNALAREEPYGETVDYFGADCRQPPRRRDGYDDLFDPELMVAAFTTPEIAIDPEALAAAVRARVAREPDIRCVLRASVADVSVTDSRAEVVFERDAGRCREGYDHVVNALWDGRLAIDARVGVRPERPWLYRIKHYLRARPAATAPALPSTTIVLGPFGDIVRYPSGDLYLSWYPAGRRGVAANLCPPDWPRVLDDATADEVRRAILAGLARLVPALGHAAFSRFEACAVRGGVIVATGSTDIDDPASGLHARSDIGPRSVGRYHSISTGKLTMAPLFAKQTADRIRGA